MKSAHRIMNIKPRWDRVRFQANLEDYRPVKWPPVGPYWCSGEGEDHSIVVAYMPHPSTTKSIKEFWPEANNIEWMNTNTTLTFSDRFPKPEWWHNSTHKMLGEK